VRERDRDLLYSLQTEKVCVYRDEAFVLCAVRGFGGCALWVDSRQVAFLFFTGCPSFIPLPG
jgi:hypothetical protein